MSTAQIFNLTDEDGWATLNRRERDRGVQVDVFAANPVVEVCTGPLTDVVRESVRVDDGEEVVVPDARSRDHFDIAERARRIHQSTFRLLRPFTEEFPFGQENANPNRMIRLVYPDRTPATTSFVDPQGTFSRFPVIHIEQRVVAPTGAFIPATLEDHLVSELSHALHFGTLSPAGRAAVRIAYLAALGIDAIEDGTVGWTPNDADTRVSAYIEAFDLFANLFHAATGGTLAARSADYLANQAPTFRNNVFNRGDDVPGAVCAAIFIDYAGTAGIGVQTAVEHYLESRATTWAGLLRWVRRRFGAEAGETRALTAAGVAWGLVP